MEVSDDGVGGADAGRGSGLRGLADRVAALDGTLSRRQPGRARGTRLHAEMHRRADGQRAQHEDRGRPRRDPAVAGPGQAGRVGRQRAERQDDEARRPRAELALDLALELGRSASGES